MPKNGRSFCSKLVPYQDKVSPNDLDVKNEIYIPWGTPFIIWHDYWFGNNLDIRISIDNMGFFEHFLQLEGTVTHKIATILGIPKNPSLSCGYRGGLFVGVMIPQGSLKDNLRGLV